MGSNGGGQGSYPIRGTQHSGLNALKWGGLDLFVPGICVGIFRQYQVLVANAHRRPCVRQSLEIRFRKGPWAVFKCVVLSWVSLEPSSSMAAILWQLSWLSVWVSCVLGPDLFPAASSKHDAVSMMFTFTKRSLYQAEITGLTFMGTIRAHVPGE